MAFTGVPFARYSTKILGNTSNFPPMGFIGGWVCRLPGHLHCILKRTAIQNTASQRQSVASQQSDPHSQPLILPGLFLSVLGDGQMRGFGSQLLCPIIHSKLPNFQLTFFSKNLTSNEITFSIFFLLILFRFHSSLIKSFEFYADLNLIKILIIISGLSGFQKYPIG